MEPTADFRPLQGKGGQKGYVQRVGQKMLIKAFGLIPGKTYTLYRENREEGKAPADRNGSLSLSCVKDGFFFLCLEKPILWEQGEAGYFHALSLLPKKPAAPAVAPPAEPPIQQKEPILEPEEVLPPTVSAALPDKAPVPLPTPALRTPSAAPSVQALPEILWPKELAHVRSAIHSGTPFAPFALPGFRCMKCPSTVTHIPYLVMGYRVGESRIASLLYAVPGNSMHPPAHLPGYRYREGYWYHIQKIS